MRLNFEVEVQLLNLDHCLHVWHMNRFNSTTNVVEKVEKLKVGQNSNKFVFITKIIIFAN